MNIKKYNFNHYFELFLYILAFICFVYFLNSGDSRKLWEPILIVIVLLTIKILVKVSNIYIFPALKFSILAFILLAMFFANEFGGYSLVPKLDKIEHLFSGVILCFLGLSIFNTINKNEINKFNIKTIVLFCLFFSIAMAGLWEVYEYTTDILFGLNSQNHSLDDTMMDIICGTIGSLVTSIYIYINTLKSNSIITLFKTDDKNKLL